MPAAVLAVIASHLEAAHLDEAERRWSALDASARAEVETWTLGVRLAGWRGDGEAVERRLQAGRAALAAAGTPWRARHALASAGGRARLRLADLSGALPLLGEALGQTEFAPVDPAAVEALSAIAEAHALGGAPRKALAQAERAASRLRDQRLATGAHGRALRRRLAWVRAVAGVRTGAPRAVAARRLQRLAALARAEGNALEAAALRLDAAVVAVDDAVEAEARAQLERIGADGALGRASLLRRALTPRAETVAGRRP